MWALWKTTVWAVFQAACGRVLGVHRGGSVHTRRARTRLVIGELIDAAQALIDVLGKDERIELRAERDERLDLGGRRLGTHADAVERRLRRPVAATEPRADAFLRLQFDGR